MAIDKTTVKEITLEEQQAFANAKEGASGYVFEFDDRGNWIRRKALTDGAISVPAHLEFTSSQQQGLVLSVNEELYNYHKRLTGQGHAVSAVEFSRENGKIIMKLHTKTKPALYSEFELTVSALTDEIGNPRQAAVKLRGTWDVDCSTEQTSLIAIYAERDKVIEAQKYNRLSAKLDSLRSEYEALCEELDKIKRSRLEKGIIIGSVESRLMRSRIREIEARTAQIEEEMFNFTDPSIGGLPERLDRMANKDNRYIGCSDEELRQALEVIDEACHDIEVYQNEITLEQQRLFIERNKKGYHFDFDEEGYWIVEPDFVDGEDDVANFARLGEDFFRGGQTYGDETRQVAPNVKRKAVIEARLYTLGMNYSRKDDAERKALESELQVLYAADETSRRTLQETSDKGRILLMQNLRLTREQAAGAARTIQQQLFGDHKRLTGQEDGSSVTLDYTVKFFRQNDQDDSPIVIELRTKTDPELYSRYEIAVSELTDENGEPKRGRIQWRATRSSNGSNGHWADDGYHYSDLARAELFWPSLQAKQEAAESENKSEAIAEPLPSQEKIGEAAESENKSAVIAETLPLQEKIEKAAHLADKPEVIPESLQAQEKIGEKANLNSPSEEPSTNEFQRAWFEIVDAALELASFIMAQVMISAVVKKISALSLSSSVSSVKKPQEEKQVAAQMESASLQIADETKTTADSQNRYGLFAIIGAAGKMLMNALTIEAASRNLGPNVVAPSDEIKPPTFGL